MSPWPLSLGWICNEHGRAAPCSPWHLAQCHVHDEHRVAIYTPYTAFLDHLCMFPKKTEAISKVMRRDYFKYFTGNLEWDCARNQIWVQREYKEPQENLFGNDLWLWVGLDPKVWLPRPNCSRAGRQVSNKEGRKEEKEGGGTPTV